jgi:hypothetical protein
MKKLSRKEIAEGLEQIPINQILLGSGKAGQLLTKKQKAFAEEVVRTGNKSASYRKAYNTRGKKETASRDALKVASNPRVATYIQALEQAKEAETYLLPARLRSIAIHRLTGLALNDEINPAQQLKALELIGKMTEVALFTERRELVKVTDSEQMRDQLMKSIRLAFSSGGAIDVEASEVDSLLDEISGRPAADEPGPADVIEQMLDGDQDAAALPIPGGEASAICIPGNPPAPDPENSTLFSAQSLHSIPLTKSTPKSDRLTPVNLSFPLESDTCVSTGVNPNKDTPPSEVTKEGVGGIKNPESAIDAAMENTPVNLANRKG